MRIANRLAQALLVLAILYIFLAGIGMIGAGFKVMGKSTAQHLLTNFSWHPVVGLMAGILATSLIQSSSTVTSLLVVLVGAGTLSIGDAIPMVMGANIGTSVTNTMVALGHIHATAEFRRAFAAGTVHDIFNIMVTAILFPLEVATGMLARMSSHLADWIGTGHDVSKGTSYVKVVTKPLIHAVKDLLTDQKEAFWPGIFLSMIGLALMVVALFALVKTLKRLFMARLENFFDKSLFRNTATSLGAGVALTVAVQSSSITTSLIVPLAGAGVVRLQKIFPFVVGANIGTTITAILASFAAEDPRLGLQLALAHLLFNIIGAGIFIPFKRVPTTLAREYAIFVARHKSLAVIGLLVIFFGLPLLGIGIFSLLR